MIKIEYENTSFNSIDELIRYVIQETTEETLVECYLEDKKTTNTKDRLTFYREMAKKLGVGIERN